MNAQVAELDTAAEIPPVTRIVAEWVANLKYEDIPEETLGHAKRALLDSLGCGIFGSRQEWCRLATMVAAENSPGGPCTIWGTDKKVGPIDAAMVNGTAIHGFEIDDLHVESMLHPGAVILPGVIALAQARNLSGKDILRGLVAGYEVGIRTAICSSIEHKLKGFHMTATNGTIGAAAAAAATLGLDVEQTNDAIGISVSFASGLYSARKGAMTKRLHAGLASRSGVLAGLLAEKGFTGAKDGLEVDFGGDFSTMGDDSDLSIMTDDLGDRWHINDNGFKAYASCGSTHTTVDCVKKLMEDGLSAENLENLTVNISKAGFTNVGWEYFPGGVVGMQMNGRFVAATALLKGEVFVDQFDEERMEDPETLELIKKIDFVHDPDIDALGLAKRHTVVVKARTTDGKEMEATREQRTGSAQFPLTNDDLESKFRRTAGVVISEEAAGRVVELSNTVETVESAEELCNLLAG
ncbi:MAG: 2-methylcitrate dehydratase [Rhodospirillaceae bacterium]|nr:2-methylcitrate dehydratase [Rhodospirillaceae bacterium]